MNKLIKIEDTNKLDPKIKKEHKSIVLVGGCFDLLHYGHISFLKKAKSYGNFLIIALESDESVRRMKGKNRPIHTQKQRKIMLESLIFVNKVITLPPMLSDEQYYELVRKIKPNIIAATEGDPILDKKRLQAKEVNAQIIIIAKVHSPSSSQLAKLLDFD